uniref:ubiquitinyl hydrolase 1 n=1 Tax=Sinocyclocheilus rhinocerous TaxID=307959 RepID=A0A673JQ69_9TELE
MFRWSHWVFCCLWCSGLDVRCEACQRFFRDGLTISFTKILTDEAVSGWKFEIHVSLGLSVIVRCRRLPDADLLLSSRCRGASSVTPSVWWSSAWSSWLRIGSLCWNCWPWPPTRTASSTFTTARVRPRAFLRERSSPTMSCSPGRPTHALQRYSTASDLPIATECDVAMLLVQLSNTEQLLSLSISVLPISHWLKNLYSTNTGLDVRCEACQRFFRDGLTISFTKILTDEAVSGWKFEIHRCIISNTQRLVELCVVKLAQDWFPLLELLAMATNPHCKFHIYNGTRPSESVPAGAQLADDELFARPPDPRSPKVQNCFCILHDRFTSGQALNVQIIAALIKPFGQCYEFLTLHTVKKFFLPVIEMVPQFLENLTDEELKKEAKNEAKNDALSMIIKSLKNLASRVPGQEETVKNLEIFRLKMILRLLQISSFNGKMNALNEVNKVISSFNLDCFQSEVCCRLGKVYHYCVMFSQAGKHEAIVKNVHDLLAKLAWDFSPEQLDHLFDCFKASWTNAGKKQREKLLELIRRLAEDDKDGVMAHKVLNLLWNLAHSDDVPVDIMDQALSAHIKILDYSCSQHKTSDMWKQICALVFLLKDGQLWLCAPQAKQIWKCLAENAVFLCDREACFKWYSKLMGDEPDLDPDINKDFFENNVLQLDPTLLTENGMKCFERFFKAVNCREGKLVAKRKAYMMDDLELIGLDYLWRLVIQGSDDIATRAIDLLKEIYTNLGPKLQVNQVEIHEDFIQSCFDRLKASYDTLCVLDGDKDSINCARQEAIRMVRVLTVLREYITECDSDYHEERTILPMSRAFRGKHITLVVRFPNQGRQVEDLDIWSHTNDTIGSVRRCILSRIKANSTHTKVELFIGGEIVDPAEDRRLIGQLNLKDKTLITAKLTQVSTNMPSSPDSSSDSSTGSPGNHTNHYSDGPNPEVESCLPGVIMSLHLRYISFLWQIADLGCTLSMPLLRDGARVLMKLMPPDNTTVENLRAICLDHAKLGENSLSPTLDSRFFGPSASQVLYLTEVVYALLMPASGTLGDDASGFQCNFLKSGGLPLALGMLTRNNFLPSADMETRRGAYLNALKISKLLLTGVGFGHVKAVAEACQPLVEGTSPASPINQATHEQALVLQNALQSIPNPASECMLRSVSLRLAQQISDEASKYIPDICVIRAVQKIVWASGCGTVHLVFSSNEEISQIYEKTNAGNEPDAEDEQVCCEALEVMTLCFALLPTALDTLSKEKFVQICCESEVHLICICLCLSQELTDDFIFPASNVFLQFVKSAEFPAEQAIPVCSSPASINAGFELLVALSVGCVRNLKQIVNTLTDMYYLGCEALTEWEYLPPVGPRPTKGFVGLKNAGATCYMNSVIQQLYMIPPIHNAILAIEGTGSDIDDDDTSGDEKQDNESNVDPRDDVFSYHQQFDDKPSLNKAEDRQEYNIGVLWRLQVIFGHLAASRLQYYVPRGFWKQFRLWGEPVNLREQHDALEFFNSLVDSLDEALKALGHPSMLSRILGGSFADQKICQGCPHRYECEESFTTLNVDIRNHQNLLDSLEQYVKGDLLEGANAYHCEKCNKKVDTVKRLLIKKLPPVLAIQLKRFDYDWERECAIKFNDYFEFPRELDMEPYTVAGVAKLEGDEVPPESQVIAENSDPNSSSRYRLVGVLVHSGQASGGHYYSYIMQRHCNGSDGLKDCWYKFDDGDVTECKMDDDEEMKNQCFGGEYMGEVFDHMMKRMSYRRQKRWWNAYILFYERMDAAGGDGELLKYISELTLAPRTNQPKMPLAIEASVRKQNVQFMHSRMQYSLEYFQFVKKLLTCNSVYLNPPPGQDHLLPEAEEIAMISIQLAARFLFSTGFHTKKVVRGPATDWYDALCILLRHSKNVRSWFAHNVLFAFPTRFSEYLLECPSAEVRGAFAKLMVFIAHFSLQDGPCPAPVTSPGSSTQACDSVTLSDHLLHSVLNLLRREVSEHGRHLQQYFNLFVMYANLGLAEKTQLLKLSVPATFMLVALDEGPGPPIKYQYAELGKLYAVVSQLVRCCDVSPRMQSSINGNPPLANPYGDPSLTAPIMPLQQLVTETLFVRTSYVKKIIEDCSNSEETVKLLRFCCWENPQFSSTVLSELLWQVAYSYTYELRPYLDLLLQILLIEDSWQTHRIHNVLKGIPDDRDGLFDTIQRSKNHYQKRAYQCIKCMVALFTNCSVAHQILQVRLTCCHVHLQFTVTGLARVSSSAPTHLPPNNQPYTGPAAQHMNNPQRPQESWEGTDEVPPVQTNE